MPFPARGEGTHVTPWCAPLTGRERALAVTGEKASPEYSLLTGVCVRLCACARVRLCARVCAYAPVCMCMCFPAMIGGKN